MSPANQSNGGEPITAAGIEELKAELAELEGPRRIEMADRIRVARELGDLKENADYHTAKDDQSLMETRIKRLQARLRNAVVVEADESGDGRTFPSAPPPKSTTTPKARPSPGPWSARPRRTSPKASSPPSRRSAPR